MSVKPGNGLEKIREILEPFGVAGDADWMAVVLFARNLVAEMDLFTEDQKAALQIGVFRRMGKKPLDRGRFRSVVEGIQEFLLDNAKVDDLRNQLKAEREGATALYSEMSRLVQDIQASTQVRESNIQRMGADTERSIISAGSKDEVVRKLRGMITEMVDQARAEARVWEERAHQMERTANFDTLLSELYSRRALDAQMREATERATLEGRPLSFMFLDVDHFKAVNDTYGHVMGDGVLRVLAAIVSAHSLQFSGYAARFGGEELVVLCEGMDEAQALARAEVLRQDVAKCPFVPQCEGPCPIAPISITVSIGVAQLAPGQTTSDLVLAADKAMYAAKTGGRNQVVGYSTLSPGHSS
ncbi:MAG: GGDEF domain-containing protein [Proteobacteria bacterium]|nr:GGDEF domain-containing protein [Pseudomonadota bacterium]